VFFIAVIYGKQKVKHTFLRRAKINKLNIIFSVSVHIINQLGGGNMSKILIAIFEIVIIFLKLLV
jgi:hypothetical protein